MAVPSSYNELRVQLNEGVEHVVKVSLSTGNPVVGLSGEIDMATAQALRSSLGPWIEAGGPIVLDFSDVSFMDSTGLRVLIEAATALGERGCIIIHGAHGATSTVLRMTKVDEAMENVHFIECDVLVAA
jgi:anti-anti-sigma factor